MRLDEPSPKRIVGRRQAVLGGARRKFLLLDDAGGEWLFKPASDEQILVDIAASKVAQAADVPSPVVYAREFVVEGRRYRGSLQPWIGEDVAQGELSRTLQELTPEQREVLQRHQVVDWLLANADAHRGQFLILRDGTLVAVDKSQSLRYFPHDRLSWQNYPWWANRRPPVYAHLFVAVKAGLVELQPQVAILFAALLSAALGAAATVTGRGIREIWRPTVSRWSPIRLFYATLAWDLPPGAAVDLVLDRIEARADELTVDFERLYYEASEGIWSRARQ